MKKTIKEKKIYYVEKEIIKEIYYKKNQQEINDKDSLFSFEKKTIKIQELKNKKSKEISKEENFDVSNTYNTYNTCNNFTKETNEANKQNQQNQQNKQNQQNQQKEKFLISYLEKYFANFLDDEFGNNFLKEINLARNDLAKYSINFKKLFDLIVTYENQPNRTFLKLPKKMHIELEKGEYSINKAIKYLNKIKYKNLEKLQILDELKINIPKSSKEISNDNIKNFLKKEKIKLRQKFKGKYSILHCESRVLCDDSYYGFLLFLLSEKYDLKNLFVILFNKKLKYIGINWIRISDCQFRVFLTFAKDDSSEEVYLRKIREDIFEEEEKRTF